MTKKTRKLHPDSVTPDDTVLIGPRGGEYVIRDGIKYYISREVNKTKSSHYNPRRGAYRLFTANQKVLSK
tara:strand:+ start:1158 stop:1367 length:210 start_codon:yes stop_codon:yes gene_type:complete